MRRATHLASVFTVYGATPQRDSAAIGLLAGANAAAATLNLGLRLSR